MHFIQNYTLVTTFTIHIYSDGSGSRYSLDRNLLTAKDHLNY